MKENKRQTLRPYARPKLSSYGKVSDLTHKVVVTDRGTFTVAGAS